MNDRREFLKQLIRVPLLGNLFAAALIAGGSSKKYLISEFGVAGFQFHDGQSVLDQMEPGDKLKLTVEPDNPYDKFAVSLQFDETMIGYVPRGDNQHISRLLRHGFSLTCEIDKADPNAVEPWETLQARVYIAS